jgi:hypothetical protein
MPLKMRQTGLGSGTYKDNVDYNVLSGEWLIGRIYERNGFPDEVRLFWPLHRSRFARRRRSKPGGSEPPSACA